MEFNILFYKTLDHNHPVPELLHSAENRLYAEGHMTKLENRLIHFRLSGQAELCG